MPAIADLAVDERRSRVVFSLLAEPDDATTGRLLQRRGAVETLQLLDGDAAVPGVNRVNAQVWRDRLSTQGRVESSSERLREVEEAGFAIVVPGDAEWPRALEDLGERAPYVQFVRGAMSLLARPVDDVVTVTGSRASTSYGEHVAGELARDLANRERLLVAGSAYGIEGAVHRGALAAGGDTVAVLAGGVDRLYPRGHRDLLDRIADVGALVSELPPGSAPTRHHFLSRNRLLAALSGTTVVVEAAARSGALGVANEAHRLDRDVGAVPGPVTNVSSNGTHELLRTGLARLVKSANDVEHLMPQNPQVRAGLSTNFQRHNAAVSRRPDRSR